MTDFSAAAPTGGMTTAGSSAALPIGTELLTLAGALPVEALYPGDKLITRDAGAQPLVRIMRHPVPEGMRFVAVSRNALGGKPTRDVILPACQPILVRDWRARAMFGTPSARVPLARLVDGDHLRRTQERPAALLTLTCARVHILYADGLEVMSTGTGTPV